MTEESVFNREELLESLDNDEILAREIITIFLTDTRARLAVLRDALSSADFETLRHTAHAIKGSAAYVYATAIRESAATLEVLARNNAPETDEFAKLLEDLERHYREFTHLLEMEQA